MAEAIRRAFVCGHPIAHSRSPLIHGFWLSLYGISGSYERLDVQPQAFAKFLDDLPESGFAGGNVTLPHKQAAAALVDRMDDAAELIGAVNTLWVEEGRVHGANTDASGFAANLDQAAPGWREGRTAMVLGAGGAARAVIFALKEAGFRDIRVVNRTRARAEELVRRFGGGVSVLGWLEAPDAASDVDLLVNTTSLGMGDAPAPPLDPALLPERAIVCDIVYVPLETALLAAAKARGLRTVGGLGMLLHQAVPGFSRWFGKRPEVTPELRAHIVADLEARL